MQRLFHPFFCRNIKSLHAILKPLFINSFNVIGGKIAITVCPLSIDINLTGLRHVETYGTCRLVFWEDAVNWNKTGILNFTRTGLPFCLPGVHLGMAFTTRKASASSDG